MGAASVKPLTPPFVGAKVPTCASAARSLRLADAQPAWLEPGHVYQTTGRWVFGAAAPSLPPTYMLVPEDSPLVEIAAETPDH